MVKNRKLHFITPYVDYQYVDAKFLNEIDPDLNLSKQVSEISHLMSSCGIFHLCYKEDVFEFIYRICAWLKGELVGDKIIFKEGTIANKSTGLDSLPLSVVINLLGIMTGPWRTHRDDASINEELKLDTFNYLSSLPIFSDSTPFTEWQEKHGAKVEAFFQEEEIQIPVNFNYEKIMKGEMGEYIAHHLLGNEKETKLAIEEMLEEHEYFEPLVYLAWLWANGFIVETNPLSYNVDRRVPLYTDYCEDALGVKGTMYAYQLFALKDFLKDTEQVS